MLMVHQGRGKDHQGLVENKTAEATVAALQA